MNKSDSITELAKALSIFQGELKLAKKDESNPFFKMKYASLASIWEVIREPLAKNGLSVTQLPYVWNDKVILTTMLMHSSGEWLSSELLVTPVKSNDPQSMGSALTYTRRYSLGALLGVAAEEDDDAETASGRGQVEPKTQVEKHWCAEHNVAFRKMHSKDGKAEWYSHKKSDGLWCKEKKEVKVEKETKKEEPKTPIEITDKAVDTLHDALRLKSTPSKEQSDSKPQGTLQEAVMADLKILVNRKPQIWTIDKTITELKKLGGVGATVTLAVQSLPPDKLREFHDIVKKVLPKEV